MRGYIIKPDSYLILSHKFKVTDARWEYFDEDTLNIKIFLHGKNIEYKGDNKLIICFALNRQKATLKQVLLHPIYDKVYTFDYAPIKFDDFLQEKLCKLQQELQKFYRLPEPPIYTHVNSIWKVKCLLNKLKTAYYTFEDGLNKLVIFRLDSLHKRLKRKSIKTFRDLLLTIGFDFDNDDYQFLYDYYKLIHLFWPLHIEVSTHFLPNFANLDAFEKTVLEQFLQTHFRYDLSYYIVKYNLTDFWLFDSPLKHISNEVLYDVCKTTTPNLLPNSIALLTEY